MPKEPKTRPTGASVADFLAAVEKPRRRADGQAICALMGEVSGETPVMWGASIVGFGTTRTHTGDWPVIAFSPRASHLVLYVSAGEARERLLADMGPVKSNGGCVYVSDLSKLPAAAVRAFVEAAWREGGG